MIFVLGRTWSRERIWLISDGLAKLLPGTQKLYQITYIFWNPQSSVSIQPFDSKTFTERSNFSNEVLGNMIAEAVA